MSILRISLKNRQLFVLSPHLFRDSARVISELARTTRLESFEFI